MPAPVETQSHAEPCSAMQRRSRAVRSPRAPGAEPPAAEPPAPAPLARYVRRSRARLGRAVCTACPGEHPRWLNTAYVSLGPRAAARVVPAGWGAHWGELATRLLVLVSALPLQLCAHAAATPLALARTLSLTPRPNPDPTPTRCERSTAT